MSISSAYSAEVTAESLRSTTPLLWTEPMLRQSVEALQRQACRDGDRDGDRDERAVGDIVRLGLRPEIQAALRGRRDAPEAVRDLATRYAFEALMTQGRAFHELDAMSQALIQRTLDIIYKRAAQVTKRAGEDPLDEEPGLLLSICKCLSRYVPKRPMGAHISWKLQHYESAVSRAMRQIENLIRRPEVTEQFAAYILDAAIPDVFKAQLLQLARGGGREGVNYEAVIRFFTLPATVEFVKGFAGKVQTARTLYAEDEYHGMAWQGQRRLPIERRQGYLEAALAQFERQQEVSLDTDDFDLHDVVGARPTWSTDAMRSESFEVWITRRALEARPDDPLWQAGEHLFVKGLPLDEIVARGLADRETLAAAQERMESLRADPDMWRAWMAETMAR